MAGAECVDAVARVCMVWQIRGHLRDYSMVNPQPGVFPGLGAAFCYLKQWCLSWKSVAAARGRADTCHLAREQGLLSVESNDQAIRQDTEQTCG